MPTIDNPTITASTVAEILGINRRQVLRLAAAGKIPTLGKLGDGTSPHLFNRADILAIAESAPVSGDAK